MRVGNSGASCESARLATRIIRDALSFSRPPRSERAPRRAEVEVLASGPYRIVAAGVLDVEIDGEPAAGGFVELPAGRHRVSWTGASGVITLTAATCPERRGLAAAS